MSQMVGPQRHAIHINNKTNNNSNEMAFNSLAINDTNSAINCVNEDNSLEVGYYLHRNKLGEGGFGTVRLATHLKTGLKVAVKIMNKNKLGADLFRVRVEINSLKALQHENIAQLLQVIETKDDIYLILEYCSGGELFDYLVSKSRLTEKESKTIMRDLVNALAFIHANGFAHRDLKPENILFDANHRIKLIDFGLAANCRDNNTALSHLTTCCGSPAYAAPELLQGMQYSGPSVDVWSAGVLLYALLIGKLPFDDDNIGALYKKIQAGVYRLPDWLSKDVSHLIKSMLKTNPEERITITQILCHPWLCIHKEQQKSSIQFLKPNLDEEVFYKCHLLFPEITIKNLKHNIMNVFGYQTATYWLLKNKAQTIQNLLETPLERVTHNKCCKGSDEPQNKENDTRPKLIGAKRKLVELHDIKGSPNKCQDIDRNAVVVKTSQKVKADLLMNSPSKIPVPVKVDKSNPKSKPKADCSMSSPVIPNKKPRLFIGLNDSHEHNKSPLQNVKSKAFSPKTPTTAKIERTPKKSLLKRILETATPARSHSPRMITTSTTSKNITLTTFTEPQKCIEKLIETLNAKGIQCKQKDFSLRCVLLTNNVITLSFNLEICKFHNRCVIQRKRLKGDAWNYLKVCEEILRISNE